MARLKDKDGTPAFKWKKKAATVNVANLNPNLIKYIDTLPPELQEKILATSGNDSGHSKKSRHYSDSAIDLRFDDDVWKHIEKDPNRLKFGLTLLDPNHGSAKHIHLSHGDGSENKKDVWMNPYSDEAKELYSGLGDVSTTAPVGESIENTAQQNNARQMETINALMSQIQQDTETNALQKQVIAKEEQKQAYQLERTKERNNILDAIGQNTLQHQGRKFKADTGFEQGGEVGTLDEMTQFKINALKSQGPPPESSDYLSIKQNNNEVTTRLQTNQKMLEMLSKMTSNPSEVPSMQSGVGYQQEATTTPTKEGVYKGENTSKELIFNELKALGLNTTQIAGAIGSLSGESYGNLSPTAENPKSKAFGIAQWYKSRLVDLKKFSSDKGLDFKSPEAQAKFLALELTTTHKRALQGMLKSKDLAEATEVWTRLYEVPNEREIRDSLGSRVKFAQDFYNNVS